MLSELQIENIAVIKKATIVFDGGFNVMTGETGAGKSIVIDSINAVLGERTSRELIRTGADYAFVSALFFEKNKALQQMLSSFDLPIEEDGAILIQRKMSIDGRNLCKINGATVTVSTIKEVAKLLVNIHGQSDNQLLLNPENHCNYIDALAQNEKTFLEYQNAYTQYIDAKKAYDSISINETNKLRRLDILNFQIEELESAQIEVGEIEKITDSLNILRNAEKIITTLQNAYQFLSGDDEGEGAVALSMQASRLLEGLQGYTDEYAELFEGIKEAAYNLEAYTDELRNVLSSDCFDENQAEYFEERLDFLSQLRKKYGDTEEEMLQFLENAKKEREEIEFSDVLKEKRLNALNEAHQKAYELAVSLQSTRKKAAEKFQKDVSLVLTFLDMPSVVFEVQFQDLSELSPTGIDNVAFYLSTNAGEELKPLYKIASGGELSRIMLAIKSVLAGKDEINTLIFDEIDTGVSGRAAQKIAIQLKKLSRTHQVICVTHLAQIAAFASTHLRIQKHEKDGKTYTELNKLDYQGRKEELARILGGLTITDIQLQNAEELLKNAKL